MVRKFRKVGIVIFEINDTFEKETNGSHFFLLGTLFRGEGGGEDKNMTVLSEELL